jgi:hypothetical protein
MNTHAETSFAVVMLLFSKLKIFNGNLTFTGPYIVIHSYNESQRDALFLKFI